MNHGKPTKAMLILQEGSDVEAWVKLALALGVAPDDVYLRSLITVPADKSLSEAATQVRSFRDALEAIAHDYAPVYEKAEVRVDYRPMELVLAEIATLNIDTLIIHWMGPTTLTGGLSTNDILPQAPCDVILVKGEAWKAEGPVLLSLRGGPNLTLAVKVANALAQDSTITLFHAADDRRSRDLSGITRAVPRIQRTITAVNSIFEGLLREAPGHKAVVLGATFQKPEIQGSSSSPLIERLSTAIDLPFVLVRSWRPEAHEFELPRQSWPREESLSTYVDRWFAENTFHSHEFSDLQALMALKEKLGVTISIGLPALNEEDSVGKVIRTIKQPLMDEIPLIDEIVLIDSNSTDNTVAIAESCGIPVYKHPDILPEMGSYRGKGEALWKSLHVLKGDIIVWIDTDITNIHPRFIYGLIGPLLRRPQVQFVKGYYNRPITIDGKKMASGGGRVTELVARPLLNLFYPELSGIIQPLSGEYAGRREALESVPFFSGYGVETGMLIDLLEQFGLKGIAQVDLEERVHYNQPLIGLSKMSFAILQVFISRLESRYSVSLLEHANRSMKMIISEPERFALEVAEIGDVERPAMNTVPGYNRRRI